MRLIGTLTATVVAGLLLISATPAGAFTLLSPALTTPPDGSFVCRIFNFAPAAKRIAVSIDILRTDGTLAPTDGTFCGFGASGNVTLCFQSVSEAGTFACRLTVTGVGKDDVRATAATLDSAGNTTAILEAH